MLVRGVLEKRAGDGSWRPRAFEVTGRELAYEERIGKEEQVRTGRRTRTRRASIPAQRLGAVSFREDKQTLVVVEVGGAYVHFLRWPSKLSAEDADRMPSMRTWRDAIANVIQERVVDCWYDERAKSEDGAPLRVNGYLLKKGGSRGNLLTTSGRVTGGRRNWSERYFRLDADNGVLFYYADDVAKGMVKLRATSTVEAPDSVRLRGRHAESLRTKDGVDEDPLYFELKHTLDEYGKPRDTFAMRALHRRDFDEWNVSLNCVVQRLKRRGPASRADAELFSSSMLSRSFTSILASSSTKVGCDDSVDDDERARHNLDEITLRMSSASDLGEEEHKQEEEPAPKKTTTKPTTSKKKKAPPAAVNAVEPSPPPFARPADVDDDDDEIEEEERKEDVPLPKKKKKVPPPPPRRQREDERKQEEPVVVAAAAAYKKKKKKSPPPPPRQEDTSGDDAEKKSTTKKKKKPPPPPKRLDSSSVEGYTSDEAPAVTRAPPFAQPSTTTEDDDTPTTDTPAPPPPTRTTARPAAPCFFDD